MTGTATGPATGRPRPGSGPGDRRGNSPGSGPGDRRDDTRGSGPGDRRDDSRGSGPGVRRGNSRGAMLMSCLLLPLVAGCSTVGQAGRIGEPPALSPVDPQLAVPLPRPESGTDRPGANSLWQPGAKHFFGDQRARRVGDILTVNVAISDRASLSNSSSAVRTGNQSSSVNSAFGLNLSPLPSLGRLGKIDFGTGASFSNSGSHTGTGSISRGETISLTVAATVSRVLPNGNFVIAGSQEVNINYEQRRLYISGIIRPEDISAANTISHTQIAEARILYGGQGDLDDVQKPRAAHQVIERLSPF